MDPTVVSQLQAGWGAHIQKMALNSEQDNRVLGGVLSIWLAKEYLADRYPGLRASWSVDLAVAFLPGAFFGGLVGWFIIRPVNVVLGWFFRAFNRAFDRLTAFYGSMVSGVLAIASWSFAPKTYARC